MEHTDAVMVDEGGRTQASALTTGQRCLLAVGTMGPLGYAPASGTVTVLLVGVPVYWLYSLFDVSHIWPLQIGIAVVFALVSVWIHAAGDRALGEKDSSKLVWDEVAGFLVAIIAVRFTWQLAVIAFFAERAIDILKVPPGNVVENRVPGGWGVVGDDIVAGLWTLALLHAIVWFAPGWVGLPVS